MDCKVTTHWSANLLSLIHLYNIVHLFVKRKYFGKYQFLENYQGAQFLGCVLYIKEIQIGKFSSIMLPTCCSNIFFIVLASSLRCRSLSCKSYIGIWFFFKIPTHPLSIVNISLIFWVICYKWIWVLDASYATKGTCAINCSCFSLRYIFIVVTNCSQDV